jgi:cytochrome c-type biogenesis protein CcmH/NrfG
MFVFLLVTANGKNRIEAAVIFALFALVLYVPAGYYLELYLYRRRQRRKQEGR